MIIRAFDSSDYAALVQIHDSLGVVWPEQPPTADGWAEADRRRNPKCLWRRWVAEREGAVVGFGQYWQSSFDYHPNRFYVNVEVRPADQRQGIGNALFETVLAALEPLQPKVLRANAFMNLPAGYRFLVRHGFREVFRETPVHLDVQAFDPTPYADLEARLRRKGIEIKSLRELETDPGRDERLYQLYWETAADVPQEDTRIEPQAFDEWVRWSLNDPTLLPDAYSVAIHDGVYVGLRELGQDPGSDTVWGGLLGVRRAYRRQGIGLALQLRGIRYAQARGCARLKTCTAIQNIEMQALFNKLGYARDPEWQQCQKDL